MDVGGLRIKKVDSSSINKMRKTSSCGSLPTSWFEAVEREEALKRGKPVSWIQKKKSICSSLPDDPRAKVAEPQPQINEPTPTDEPAPQEAVGVKDAPKSEKEDIFDWRPWGVPKRVILGVAWVCAVIATWCVTHDAKKTAVAAICAPFVGGFFLLWGAMVSMVGVTIVFFIAMFFDSIVPKKYRKIQWGVLVLLWVSMPLYAFLAKGDVVRALSLLALVPITVFGLLWFLGVFCSWIAAACEVKNPLFKILAIIGVLLAIIIMTAVAVTSKNSGYDDDYEQWDRRDSTYR